jgi:hypothetical protein
MIFERLFTCLMVLLFTVIFCFNPGCSKDQSKENPSLMEKVKKTEETMGKKYPGKSTDDPMREKHMAVAYHCSEKYEACLEECAKKDSNDKCEGKCKDALSLCEKDLPADLKSFK